MQTWEADSGSGASMCKGPAGADNLPAVFMWIRRRPREGGQRESRGGV